MSESENSDQELHEPPAYGQQLMLAREKAGMTIEEAARALNLKEKMVEAIEDSDLQNLPPVAFVKGYIRNYARLLGMAEEKIISEFEQEVPHQTESELHPRSVLPGQADSQTPVIKLISGLIIVFAAGVLVYAAYSYYMEKSERMELAELFAHDDRLIQQRTDFAEDDTLMPQAQPDQSVFEASGLEASESEASDFETGELETSTYEAGELETIAFEAGELETSAFEASELETSAYEAGELETSAFEAGQAEQTGVASVPDMEDTVDQQVEADSTEDTADEVASVAADEDIMPVPTVVPMTGGDVLVVSAEQESWAEIVDANDIRLFYGMLQPERELSLTGQAPFDIFLGNAPVVSLSLNATEIDMTKFTRSNNIAQFKVSVEDGRLLFH